MNKSHFTIALLALTIQLSCTRLFKDETTMVTITLPPKVSQMSSKSLTPESSWGLAQPTSLDTLDCYAIYLAAAELGGSSCKIKDQVEDLKINRLYGQFAAGSTIELEVPRGKQRILGVLGFQSTNGQCQPVTALNFKAKDFSEPLFVGSSDPVDLNSSEASIKIDISMTGSKVISDCSGASAFDQLPKHYWPPAACQPTVTSITNSGSDNLQINGHCLALVQNLQLKNQTTQNTINLNLINKSEQQILAQLGTQVQLRMGQVMQLLVQTVYGQTQVPFELTLGPNSVPLNALDNTGASDGFILQYNQTLQSAQWVTPPTGGSPSPNSGFGFKVMLNGIQIGESKAPNLGSGFFTLIKDINSAHSYRSPYGQQFNHINSNYYFFTDIIATQNFNSSLSLKDLLYYEGFAYPIYNFYFTGTDCTGDLLLMNDSSYNTLRGNTFAYPSSCSSNSDLNLIACSGLSYKKIMSTGQFETNVSIQSTITTQSAYSNNTNLGSINSNFIICQNQTTSSSSGWRYPASSLQTATAPDLPIINTTQISFTR